jgi:hypothetical protein
LPSAHAIPVPRISPRKSASTARQRRPGQSREVPLDVALDLMKQATHRVSGTEWRHTMDKDARKGSPENSLATHWCGQDWEVGQLWRWRDGRDLVTEGPKPATSEHKGRLGA